MNNNLLHKITLFFLALVWLVNGLFCKVLHLVPRHEQIVTHIIGRSWFPSQLTKIIGIAEVLMSVWILSGIKKRLNALTQILVVAIMNVIEFILVPDLLLWGRMNSVFACLFILLIYLNEFHWKKEQLQKI